jgi:hypothetical protein
LYQVPSLANLPGLRKLTLNYNNISVILDESTEAFSHLTNLSMTGNPSICAQLPGLPGQFNCTCAPGHRSRSTSCDAACPTYTLDVVVFENCTVAGFYNSVCNLTCNFSTHVAVKPFLPVVCDAKIPPYKWVLPDGTGADPESFCSADACNYCSCNQSSFLLSCTRPLGTGFITNVPPWVTGIRIESSKVARIPRFNVGTCMRISFFG